MYRRVLASLPVALLTLLASVVLLGLLGWPVVAAWFPPPADTAPDPVTISDYRADLRVDEAGTLHATETVTAVFPCCRHGIFRYFDVVDPSDPHARLVPYDIEVTVDGHPATTALSWESGRRYRVAKIGDADTTLDPGTHVYRISYAIDGALSPASAGRVEGQSGSWTSSGKGSAFYWNVVAGGWQMSMDRTTSTIGLPEPADDVQCTYGYQSQGRCRVVGEGTDTVTVRTGPLGPRTPVTVRLGQDLPTPDRRTLPWTVPYDGVLGQSLPLAAVLGALALVGLLVGRGWEWRSREPRPGYPVSYEPPPAMGPVQTYFVMHETVPGNAVVASLLHAADRGLVKLTEVGQGDWSIESLDGDWAGVDRVTRVVADELGLTAPGSSFRADGSIASGSRLQSTTTRLTEETRAWAREEGLVRSDADETLGRVLVVVAGVVTVVLAWWHPAGMTLWAAPTGGFAVGGVGLLRPGVGSRRTTSGREQWSRAGGFHRLLSTPSAEDRFDFSARKGLYLAYIPYAVAFGCADEWARKYRLATGQEPPTPAWYVGGQPGLFAGGGSSFASFESSVRSSIGAYQASQHSSSSGGFSGGGGGGGGGGGSW